MPSGQEHSWSVCATVNERPEVLENFVRHYFNAGAKEIFLFFDQPDETVMKGLQRHSAVTCLPSIALPGIDGKPASHEDKQINNFRHALEELSTADWVGHVDADELIFPIGDEVSFSRFLGGVAKKYKSVKIAPVEAVFRPGDDTTRVWSAAFARFPLRPRPSDKQTVPSKGVLARLRHRLFGRGASTKPKPADANTPAQRQALMREVYGPLARKFLQQGLAGHYAGKSFLRRGETFSEILIHRATPVSGEILAHEGDRFAIVHFDALSYGEWLRKWRRRAEKQVNMVMMSDRRTALLDEFRIYDGDDERQRALFEALYVLDERQIALLAGAGLAFRIMDADSAKPRIERLSIGELSLSQGIDQQIKTSEDLLANRKWDGEYHRAVENIDPQLISTMRDGIFRSDFQAYRNAFARIGSDRFTDRRKLIQPSASTNIERVVFIAGVHRSGTTLLESLIQERYDVRVLRAPVPENEGQFLQDVMRDEVVYGGPGMFAFFNQNRLGPVPAGEAAGIRERLLLEWDHWTLGQSNCLLEKTPANIVRIPYLRSVFPLSKFIVLVRDPRAVVLSVKKWNPSPNELLFMNWCSAYATALNDVDDDCIFVRYEDLCDDPARELERIAHFAAIDKRPKAAAQQTRYEEIRNSNGDYIPHFPKMPLPLRQRLVFRPWEILGYDLEEAFEKR